MGGHMPERDWRLFRDLRVLAPERYCRGVLKEVCCAAAEDGSGSHERYLKVSELLRERDGVLAGAYNDPRCSVAMTQLLWPRRLKLINEAEFAEFSPETWRPSPRCWSSDVGDARRPADCSQVAALHPPGVRKLATAAVCRTDSPLAPLHFPPP